MFSFRKSEENKVILFAPSVRNWEFFLRTLIQGCFLPGMRYGASDAPFRTTIGKIIVEKIQ